MGICKRLSLGFVISFILLSHGLVLGGEIQLTAHQVLNEYVATMSRVPVRFAVEMESSSTVESNFEEKRQEMTRYRYRRDGDRLDVDRSLYGLDAEGKALTVPKYRTRAMIDGEGHAIAYYGATTAPTEVLFTADGRKELGYTRAQLGSAGALDGYLANDQVGLVELLRQAKDLRLHPSKETVQGVECYLLEASTDHGTYKVWLDPSHGYLPRKAIVQKRGGDVFDHKPLTETPLLEADFILSAVEIQQVDGRLVPVACETEETWRLRDGRSQTMHTAHKRARIDFDPDFQAMGAFTPDIPNGTRVNYQDYTETGLAYQWMDGKLVPLVDDADIKDMDIFTNSVKEGTVSMAPNGAVPSNVPGVIARISTRPVAPDKSVWSRVVLVTIVGGALLAAVFLTLRFYHWRRAR